VRSARGGPVRFTLRYEGGDVAGVHRIHTVGGSIRAASDLATAEIAGGGPYLSGRLAFTAATPDADTPGISRRGTLKGRFTVRFDGLTPVTIVTLGGAALRLR
jgi:hypothetical protein